MPHELPTLPWEKFGADFLDFNGSKYLVVVDYYFKYIDIASLKSTNVTTVIKHFKNIFSHHGIHSQLITDGGPLYSPKEL